MSDRSRSRRRPPPTSTPPTFGFAPPPRRTGPRGTLLASILASILVQALPGPAAAQAPFTIEDVLSPPFPYDLVAARAADRIAWLSYEEGRRNVHTAAAPDFRPIRLTDWDDDDGRDLTGLQISDDGATLLFVRGHTPNRQGWIANPASDPAGAKREAWALSIGADAAGAEAWRVAEAWDPALSPDGRWIAYTRDGQVHRAPVSRDALAGVDPDTLPPLFTVFGANRWPVWSPDSRRIAFVSHRDDHAFVGVHDATAGTVTYLAPSVDFDGAPAWSPDGTRVAFLRRPGEPFDPPEERPWWERSPEPDTALPDGMERAGFAGGHRLEIWVADAATGAGHRLWHTDAGSEAFTDLRALDWVGGHLVLRSEPGDWEGQRFALPVPPADAPPEAWTEVARSDPRALTTGGIVEHAAYTADGRFMIYDTNAGDIDRRHLWRVPIAGGEPERLTGGETLETWPVALPDGERIALLQAGPALPQSVAVMRAGGPGSAASSPRVITSLPAAFPRGAHVTPEPVLLTAPDGREIHAQLFLPPDLEPGERRPALLFLHGGPRRQMLLGYHYMHFYHMAYAMNQYFAAAGYVTLAVNYRSGIGYGVDFRDVPDYGRRGASEYQDVLAAGLYLRERPDVDREQVGLWGLSYGGILTATGLARNSDVFRAGVDMAGVHLYGGADDPESTLYRSSAVADVDRWTSPVLLIHGDDDRNVDFSQTVGLVQLLRARGVPHELIVFPDEVHDFLLFSRWLHAFRATDDFFRRTLVRGEAVGVGVGLRE